MKVEKLLDIVASQECVFDGDRRLVLVSESSPSASAELYVEGSPARIAGVYSAGCKCRLFLGSFKHRLERLDPELEITTRRKQPKFKIGFLDYEDGWVETVTSEELGLSEATE